MNQKKNFIFGIIFAAVFSNGFAAQGRWTEGVGQGNLEYFIDQGDFRLRIDCPTQDGSSESQSGVSLSKISSDQEIENFTIYVNGTFYEAPFVADSRSGDNAFLSLLADLRKGDVTVKIKEKSIKFPRSNAAKIIPIHGKNFECNLSF